MMVWAVPLVQRMFFSGEELFSHDAQTMPKTFFDDAQHDAHIFDDAQEPLKGG